MKRVTILVVDDEADVRQKFVDDLSSHASIRLLVADSVTAGLELIKNNFIHVALVDLHLASAMPNAGPLFKLLADERPSCSTLLFTQYPTAANREHNREHFFRLLDPFHPQIKGAVDKQRYDSDWSTVIVDFARPWVEDIVDVQGAAEVADLLARKAIDDPRVLTTADEIDHLVSRLLGQGAEGRTRSQFNMNKIRLDVVTGGRSTSVVTRGQPENSVGQRGIWCVIKFSPRRDAREEFQRYCQYVRFIVSEDYRVELLGFVEGDTVGAMCYSFAGRSPGAVSSLNELFCGQSERAENVLNSLFDLKARFWYGMEGPSDTTLAAHFNRSYRLEPQEVLPRARKLMDQIAGKLTSARLVGGDLVIKGDKILSPEHAIGTAAMRARHKMTMVHGDMNANNVLCSDDGRVILIDYRHAGFGPRAADFAALECSLRLSQELTDFDAVTQDHRRETAVWKGVWGNSQNTEYFLSNMKHYWENMAYRIGRHARANFPDLNDREYAATCLLWALRVLRASGLSELQRFRLLIWMSYLTKVITSS